MRTEKKYIILLLAILLFNIINFASISNEETEVVFSKIKTEIIEANVSELTRFFSNKTYISLMGNQSGYFSNNQVYYILKDFFKKNRPKKLISATTEYKSLKPFITGTLIFFETGIEKKAYLFISLEKIDGIWYISQFTLN